jgi:DNA-binding XRE family transcriptional regulator
MRVIPNPSNQGKGDARHDGASNGGRPMVPLDRLPEHGRLLREARVAKGLTMAAVGEAAGLRVFTIANAERGHATIDAYIAISLALGLNIAVVLAARLRAKDRAIDGAADAPKRP